MTVLEEIRNDAAGLASLRDWLGEGGVPVDSATADARTAVCAGCPQNVRFIWWENTKHAIAETIKRHLAVKHRLELHAENEDNVAMCRACGCCLRLKVWVPMDVIRPHTTPEQLAKMPEPCWIRKGMTE